MTLVLSTAATAATYSVVTSFGISKGYYARGDVVELADGSLVGTAVYGGASNRGTVFKIDSAGEASILHSFKGADGSSPYGGLIRGSDGLLYGTTAGGGANDLGVLFKITTTGTYTLLHSFAGYDPVTATYPEGTNPYGGLVEGPDGNFYGLTRFGGAEDGGTIFRVSPGGTFAIARSLAFDDGGESTAALVRGSDDLLYGVTPAGGTTGLGTIFSYATGTGAFTILHTFSAADGYGTFGRLAEGADGKLYGATSGGGANDNGTVFSIERDGSFFSVEYSLAGFNSGLGYAPDGSRIAAGLTKGTDNSLYGVASAGGSASGGTFFKFTPGAGFTMLHPFTSAEGKHPFAGLIEGADGRFYGATTEDGTNGNGALFALSTSGSYAEAYAFDHTPAMPIGGVIKGIDGNFYGTTYAGGFGAGFGTVFKVTPDGTLTVLHRFNVTDGAQPEGTLVQAADGTLYGTTTTGGTKRLGTIFKIPTGGALTTLHAFAPFDPTLGAYPDGYSPVAGLTLSGGVLYGTATIGGLYDAGTLYQITTDGTFSVAHHFCDGDPLHDACADGADPVAGLIEGTDGALYGTTTGGGANYLGVIFKLAGGTVNVLYSFAPFDDALGYFPDGYNPLGSLTEGGDGSFYGTMANGGPLGRGVVFRFNPATSAFAVLHAFSNGADGGGPLAGMIEASDGNLYGTTSTGGPGAGAAGTVFRLAPDAVLETVFAFNTASAPLNGHTPQAPLIEASPVSFYGTASGGGEARSGVVFNLSFVTGPLALTSPNGGEKLFTGTPYRIDWTSSLGGIASFDLFYSTNGTTYSPIAGCSGLSSAARSCPWTSPGPVSSTVTVKVVATDGIGDQTSDASDAVFSIVSGTASITVTYPNTSSVSWAIGTIQQIKWNHNLAAGTLVKLELSRNGGTTYDEVIAASVPCTGATNSIYNWPVTGPATKTARVRVTWTNASTSDASNNSFKIGAGFVKVQAPKAGTNIGYNTSQKQTWTSNLGALDTVDVLLSTDNGVTFPIVLASGILASKKSVTYTMPDIGTPTTQARIKVVWSNPPAGSAAAGTSPMFSVQPPFVTAVAPNGGEIWSIGSKPTVQWSSNLGALERVRLELSQDDGGTYSITMISSTPSDGKQAVSVVGGWATQTARVRIVWLKDAPVADPSNASFKIQ